MSRATGGSRSEEAEPTVLGVTALAGLSAYLELAGVSGLTESVRRHLWVCTGKDRGWTEVPTVLPIVLLNGAGGDCEGDLRVLEEDAGFARVLQWVELQGLKRWERREIERWRKERRRAVPSPSVVFRSLGAFHTASEEAKGVTGHTFLPAANEHLQA